MLMGAEERRAVRLSEAVRLGEMAMLARNIRTIGETRLRGYDVGLGMEPAAGEEHCPCV